MYIYNAFNQSPKILIPSDYILSYDFNGNLIDGSSNNNSGSSEGTTAFISGRKSGKQAINFSNGRVTPQKVTVLTGTNKLTISLWINTTQTGVSIPFESNEVGFGTSFNEFSNSSFSFIDILAFSDYSHWNIKYSNVLINDGNWHHLVLVINRDNPSNTTISIYIDSVLSALNTGYGLNAENNENFLNSTALRIGADNIFSYPFIGSMSEFKIYPRVLTDAEIIQLYNE